MTEKSTCSWLESPVGPLTVVASPAGVRQISFGSPREVLPAHQEEELLPDTGWAASAARQLADYFAGTRREFTVPVDWTPLTELRAHVLRTLEELVPFGSTVTYRQLAQLAGRPKPSVVGTILAGNPCPLLVPCHRVVASNGGLGSGVWPEGRLLVHEGAGTSLLELDLLAG